MGKTESGKEEEVRMKMGSRRKVRKGQGRSEEEEEEGREGERGREGVRREVNTDWNEGGEGGRGRQGGGEEREDKEILRREEGGRRWN